MVTCGSDPKSGRASPVELPPSPLLSPSPLSGSRGQKMRAQREGAEFYIRAPAGGRVPHAQKQAAAGGICGGPPAANWWGGRGLPPGRGRQAPSKDLCEKNIYFYLYIGPYRPPAGR